MTNIPAGTKFLGIPSDVPTPEKRSNKSNSKQEFFTKEDISDMSVPRSKSGLSIAWFGTSISTFGCPESVGTKLGATIYNEAEGGSIVRAFNAVTAYAGTFKNLQYVNCLKSLSQTLAEKQQLKDYWEAGLDASGNISGGGTFGWRDFLYDATATLPTSSYTDYFTSDQIDAFSYEKRLEAKYLDSSSPDFVAMPDYFVFEHGRNDLFSGSYDDDEASATSVPVTPDDRSTFIGSMNYLIDLILSYNARARIILIGHYEKDRGDWVYKAQENLATYRDFSLLKLWEKLGLSQNTVETTGYWSSPTTWVPSGGAPQTLTMTEIWFEDNIHPKDTEACELMANTISRFLEKSF